MRGSAATSRILARRIVCVRREAQGRSFSVSDRALISL